MLEYKPKHEPCLEWLKTSELTSTDRITYPTRAVELRMKSGNEKALMFIDVDFFDKTKFSVIPNRPGTTVEACKTAFFTVIGKNRPDAARNFIKEAGINNPKNLKV